MPFAQPPVGALRLNNPVPLNATFRGMHNATRFGPVCPGYIFADDWPFEVSEDCLTVNVIRPAGTTADDRLPVATYIYGGGYFTGSSAEAQLRSLALNGVVAPYQLSFESGEAMTGQFLVTRLEYAGDFNGERNYSVALESSGAVQSA